MKNILMKRLMTFAIAAVMTVTTVAPAMATEAVSENVVTTTETAEIQETETPAQEADTANVESVETETETATGDTVITESVETPAPETDESVITGALGTETEEAMRLESGYAGYAYYVNGVRQYTTGMVKVNGVWYNLVNGIVTGDTVAKNKYGWWRIGSNGTVDFKFTGIAKNSKGWWYCKKGKVQFNVYDVLKTTCNGVTAWYNIRGGKLVANTVAKNSKGWWYIDKTGKVDFKYTGLATNSKGRWYIKNGKAQLGYSGYYVTSSGNEYMIKKGKVMYLAFGAPVLSKWKFEAEVVPMGNRLTITWTKQPDAVGYDYVVYTYSSGEWVVYDEESFTQETKFQTLFSYIEPIKIKVRAYKVVDHQIIYSNWSTSETYYY